MKRLTFLFVAIGLVLIGCSKDSTYSTWDDAPIVVEQINNNGDYNKINEITDATKVDRLIKTLRSANWQENIDVDTRLPDYRFGWNSFNHNVWINEATGKLEIKNDERSSLITLSKRSSKIIFEILTDKEFKVNK